MPSRVKLEREQELIKAILVNIIKKESNDPLLKKATITAVRLSFDFSIAHVYVDSFKRKDLPLIVAELNKASKFFRTLLSSQLTTRRVPTLLFEQDSTIIEAEKIENLFKKIRGK